MIIKRIAFISFVFLNVHQSFGQTDSSAAKIDSSNIKIDKDVLVFAEQVPEFPGGEDALILFIQNNVKYPLYAIENKIEGTVIVQFVVEEDGSIGPIEITKGIKGGCDEEAIRIVKSMPKWKPGKQAGKTVRVWYTIPVTFKLK